MATFSEQLALIAAARKKYTDAEQNLYRAKIAIHQSKGNVPPTQYNQLLATEAKLHADARAGVAKAVADLHARAGVTKMMAEMDGHTPILLFPLRLETRFGQNAAGKSQLWIRIYPDDICVDRHERWLTKEEAEAGKAYWIDLLEAEKKSDEAAKRAAWAQLRERLGMQRALWVARQTKPQNWEARLTSPLVFPVQQDTKSHGWTRAPRSAALPDRFAAVFVRDNTVISKPEDHVGALLPDTLILGPDPFDDDNSFSKKDGEVQFGEDFAWMADFKKAVDKGMGIIVDDPERYMKGNKIERLYVVGILNSADRKDSAHLLADLFENHYYSTRKGLALVPQGTPTNNTEEGESGFVQEEDWLPKGYFDSPTVPLFVEKPDCDGKRLETALGIRAGVLDLVEKAGIREMEEAQAMNYALYPATLGYTVEILMHTVLGEKTAWQLRRFFSDHVTGRGPLPTLRVGDQPYGILLTSDLKTWKNTPGTDPFYDGLLRVLRDFQQKWDALVTSKVPFVGKTSNNPDELFLEIMALHPTSVAFRQRLGYMYDVLSMASKTKPQAEFVLSANNRHNAMMGYLKTNGFTATKSPPNKPLASHLFWHDNQKTVALSNLNLIDGLEPSETDPVAPIAPGMPNYIGRLLEWKTVEAIKDQDFGANQKAPTNLLYLLLRQAILRQLTYSVCKYYQSKNKDDKFPLVAFQKSLQNFDASNPDLTHWDMLRGKPSILGKSTLNKPLGDEILQGREDMDKLLATLKQAIKSLENLPTARLERALVEHLDCCAYRLDAWQTGLFSHRLKAVRERDGGQGVYLGAFGCLEALHREALTPVTALPSEKLRPKDSGKIWIQPQSGGLVHAPSLAHATAAGLLLAGYRQYGKPGDPAGAFAVSANSDRVRRALFLLEGIRGGQPLAALLGYQFERALHEAKRDTYIYVFRKNKQFQYQPRYIPQEGEAITVGQTNTQPAPVVDGLKILEIKDTAFVQFLTANVATLPATDHNLLKSLKKNLEESLDAVKDLLMAESAFQAAKGNADNQAALLNNLKDGIAPPLPEVIDTPRTSETIWTNRVTLHFDEKANLSGGAEKWKSLPATPRAQLEPGVNIWLANTLGDPSKISCMVSHADADGIVLKSEPVKLADLGIQAIDFVWLSDAKNDGGATELEARVAAKYRKSNPSIAAETPVKIDFAQTGAAEAGIRTFVALLPLAAYLRQLLAAARTANAQDFVPPSQNDPNAADNPTGVDLAELLKRINLAKNKLLADLVQIEKTAPNSILPKNEENPATFKQVFERIEAAGQDPEVFKNLALNTQSLEKLKVFRLSAALFGVPNAYPGHLNVATAQTDADWLLQSAAVWKTINDRCATAESQIQRSQKTEIGFTEKNAALVAAGKALFGDDFVVIPKFKYRHTASDAAPRPNDNAAALLSYFTKQYNTPSELALEEWLQGLARVRPALARLDRVRTLSDLMGLPVPNLVPMQAPFREGDSWLGLEYPPTGFVPRNNALTLAAFGTVSLDPAGLYSVLSIDEWTESVPATEETTAIAYNYNQPNAAPPQTLLLAVHPRDEDKWSWNDLIGILEDTIGRAKRRAVEPRHLSQDPVLSQFLPAVVADFSLPAHNISLDFAVANPEFLKSVKTADHPIYKPFTG